MHGARQAGQAGERAVEPAEKAARGLRPRVERRRCWCAASRGRGGRYLLTGGSPGRGKVIAAALLDEPGDGAVGVAEVAEVARACRAGADTGGDAVFLGQRVVIDAVDAEGAFLHHLGDRVHFPRAIGAGPGAEAAADAGAFVDQHDAVVGALVAGPVGQTVTQGASSQ